MRADILLLNKVDLVDAGRLGEARELLQTLRPALRIIETARAATPVELLDVAAPVRDGMALPAIDDHGIRRSEEHTSELQSLMRISYAVFCLKKKKNKTQNKTGIKDIV